MVVTEPATTTAEEGGAILPCYYTHARIRPRAHRRARRRPTAARGLEHARAQAISGASGGGL